MDDPQRYLCAAPRAARCPLFALLLALSARPRHPLPAARCHRVLRLTATDGVCDIGPPTIPATGGSNIPCMLDYDPGGDAPGLLDALGKVWSKNPIRDTRCSCHPLTGVPCLRSGPCEAPKPAGQGQEVPHRLRRRDCSDRGPSVAHFPRHSVGFVLTRAADFSAQSAQAQRPYRQALINSILRGPDRVDCRSAASGVSGPCRECGISL